MKKVFDVDLEECSLDMFLENMAIYKMIALNLLSFDKLFYRYMDSWTPWY